MIFTDIIRVLSLESFEEVERKICEMRKKKAMKMEGRGEEEEEEVVFEGKMRETTMKD